VLLAIIAFSLSLLGTFLVRSGVLSSVHAFATDPKRGLFILAFLAIVIGGSLVLYAWRAPQVGLGSRFSALSRESMLLANNVMLVVAMATVLLGTLYPLVLDALGMGKISVGPPYFDSVFLPIMVPVVFLMGVGPLARWRQTEVPDLARRLRWAISTRDPCGIGHAMGRGQSQRNGHARLRAVVVDRAVGRHRPARAPEDWHGFGRRRVGPRASTATGDARHDGRPPGHCGVRVRRQHGQDLRDRARSQDGRV
jgi:hypothetical protein